MSCLTRLLRIFRRPASLEAQIDQEIDSCLEMLIDDEVQAGLAPKEAEQAARLKIGNIHRIRDRARHGRSEYMFDIIAQDVRYGIQSLKKNRAFAGTAIAAIGIGIASVTCVFGFVNSMLWQPPGGVKDPATLIALYLDERVTPEVDYRGLSYPQYDALLRRQDVFSDLIFYSRSPSNVTIDEQRESMNIEAATGNYFPVFGVQAAVGRSLTVADDIPGAPLVAMISYDLWQQRFAGKPDVLGSTFKMNGGNFTIVGVAPKGFFGTDLDWYEFTKVWIPLASYKTLGSGSIYTTRGAFLAVLGRLKPGVDLRAAQARMDSIAPVVHSPTEAYKPDAIPLVPVAQARVGPNRRKPLVELFAVVFAVSVLILLAACFNVANFLMGQAVTRRHEMAIRLALGASRSRLVRQLVTESLVLAMSAGVLALVLVAIANPLIMQLPKLFTRIALYSGPVWDVRILALTFSLALATTFLFGLIPSLVATKRTPWEVLKQSPTGWSWSRLKPTSRQFLLAVQVAVAVVLSVSGLLFARSLIKMTYQDAGLSSSELLVARIEEPAETREAGDAFYRTLFSSLASRSGIQSASVSDGAPLSGLVGQVALSTPDQNRKYGMTWTQRVSFDYFRTVGIKMAAGREFQDSADDRDNAVLINEALAERLWPGESAVGKVIHIQNSQENRDRRVVGVAAQKNCWDRLEGKGGCIYRPIPLENQTHTIEIRASDLALARSALQEIAHSLNPQVIVRDIRPLDHDYYIQISGPRMAAVVTSAVAVLGVILSAIGCFALFSSMVKESTGEIALRIALGATTHNLVIHVVARAVVISVIGAGVGLVLSSFLGRFTKNQFYNLSAQDPLSMAVAGFAALGIAALASYLPAREAARIDPSGSLKGL